MDLFEFTTMAGMPKDEASIHLELRRIVDALDDTMKGPVSGASEVWELMRPADQLFVALNGGETLGSRANGAFYAAENQLRAPYGVCPKWGQPGRWVVRFSEGFDGEVETRGLFGIGFGGFEVRSVAPGPFVSPTGFRSFIGARTTPGGDDFSVEAWVRHAMTLHLRTLAKLEKCAEAKALGGDGD